MNQLSNDKTTIDKVINIINTISKLTLASDEYDGLLVKIVKQSNLRSKNRASHQAHIAITGPSRSLFPALWIAGYQSQENQKMKSYFYLMAPFYLYKDNIDYISNSSSNNFTYNDGKLITNVSVKLSVRDSGDSQIELGHPTLSDQAFEKFRGLLSQGDALVIAKVKGKLQYEAFIVAAADVARYRLKNNAAFVEKSKTPISASSFSFQSNNKTGRNVIYYGAPGTGKSFTLDKELAGERKRRVTFYPDYDYTDFVGGMKPKRTEHGIDYPYVGGILADSVAEAINNPDYSVYLIIEEINRANAASVFGDTFQLLDRDNNTKESVYSIDNADLGKYIDSLTNGKYDLTNNGVKFPSNLSIFATMNPADQGVYPLDTAFTRRWKMRYMKIDWNAKNVSQDEVAGFGIPWPIFGKAINHLLSKNGIEEDEMLGQFFMTSEELGDIKLVASKLLGYLWNNTLRYKRNEIFDAETLSQLMDKFENNYGLNIFTNEARNLLNEILENN